MVVMHSTALRVLQRSDTLGMKRLDDWTMDEEQLKDGWIELLHNALDRQKDMTTLALPS